LHEGAGNWGRNCRQEEKMVKETEQVKLSRAKEESGRAGKLAGICVERCIVDAFSLLSDDLPISDYRARYSPSL
jgi:hypothetical protein